MSDTSDYSCCIDEEKIEWKVYTDAAFEYAKKEITKLYNQKKFLNFSEEMSEEKLDIVLTGLTKDLFWEVLGIGKRFWRVYVEEDKAIIKEIKKRGKAAMKTEYKKYITNLTARLTDSSYIVAINHDKKDNNLEFYLSEGKAYKNLIHCTKE